MKISVVIPVYNNEGQIERAIESVLNQTHSNFELIIINDGSTDNTINVISKYSDKRIKVYSQSNSGVSVARNKGVHFSNCDWVAFLDADDEYNENFLNEMSEFINSLDSSKLSIVGSNYIIEKSRKKAVDELIDSGVYPYYTLFKNQISPNHTSTTIVKKEKFLKVGGFPENIQPIEDWILWFKLSIVGDFGYYNKPLGIYHDVDNSCTKNILKDPYKLFECTILLPITIKKYLIKYNVEKNTSSEYKKVMQKYSQRIAEIFLYNNNKMLSVKMLRHSSFSNIILAQPNIIKFLSHLILPSKLKNKIRHLKNNK